jgi:PAS domain S-box-containing protein
MRGLTSVHIVIEKHIMVLFEFPSSQDSSLFCSVQHFSQSSSNISELFQQLAIASQEAPESECVFLKLLNMYRPFNLQRISARFNTQQLSNRLNVNRIYKRFSMLIGFFVLLILLAANTIITRYLLQIQTEDQRWVSHTQEVLAQVAQIRSLIANAELGQRGFVYTGDPSFLGQYDLAVDQLDSNFQQLAQLTIDNSQEQAKISTLRSLVQARMDLLSTTILTFQSGHPGNARQMVVSERGRLLMARINNLMNETVRDESSLKGFRSAAYKSSVSRTVTSIYLASCIVALAVFFLAYYILREVSRRERRARGRLTRERWFRSALTSLGDAVIATDNRGLVTFLNPKAEQIIGVQLLSAKGQPVEKVFPLFDETTLAPLEYSVTKVIEHGHTAAAKSGAFLKGSGGGLIPITDSTTVIRDRRDKPVGAVIVFRDVSYERQMQEAHSNVDSLGISPTLLATVCRQIDAPLVAASDLIYVAKLNENIPAEASDLLTIAEGHLGRVSHISREILGFYHKSKPLEQIDLSVVVDSVLRSFANQLRSKNIKLLRDLHFCPFVSGISGELNQAVANLISNAVDAVPFGGTIHAQLSCPDNLDEKVLMLSIRDNGPGIPPANRDRLFEPFFTTKEGTGYGLGLWTTKGIVERHGGTIQVTCEDGDFSNGTTFNVFFPINAT